MNTYQPRKFAQSIWMWIVSLVLVMPALGEAAVSYHVDVNTPLLAGTSGYLDLQWNPGTAAAPLAEAALSDFAADATLQPGAQINGAVAGLLPGPLEFSNTAVLNAYLQPVVYGQALQFDLTLDATDAGSPEVGTLFSLALLDQNLESLLANDPSGIVLGIDFNTGGSNVLVLESEVVTLVAVPLPAPFGMLFWGVAALVVSSRRRRDLKRFLVTTFAHETASAKANLRSARAASTKHRGLMCGATPVLARKPQPVKQASETPARIRAPETPTVVAQRVRPRIAMSILDKCQAAMNSSLAK